MDTVLRQSSAAYLSLMLLLWLSQTAQAQSPINIEQLLAKPATWQLSSSFTYRGSSLATIQNGRQASGSTGIRYGITPRIEINARAGAWRLRRELGELQFEQQARSFSVGGKWLMKSESALPAVLIEAHGELLQRGSNGQRSLPGGSLGVTSYKSIDPVVLSLRASMSFQRGYRYAGATITPGVAWRLEPGVNFAVNANVTLFGSTFFERRNASYRGGSRLDDEHEYVGIRGGIALAVASQHSLFVSGDLASDQQGGMSVQWFYEF